MSAPVLPSLVTPGPYTFVVSCYPGPIVTTYEVATYMDGVPVPLSVVSCYRLGGQPPPVPGQQ